MENEVLVGIPTQEFIDGAKKKYGKIFSVKISGETYIYRFLKRSEYKELQKTIVPEQGPNGPIVSTEQSMELEDKIAKLCVIYPENFADIIDKGDQPAASTAVLAAYISESSGSQIEEAPQLL